MSDERVYNWFRNYDPTLGRYIQSDPVGMLGGANPYLYVRADAMVFADRFGLSSSPIGAAEVTQNALNLLRKGVCKKDGESCVQYHKRLYDYCVKSIVPGNGPICYDVAGLLSDECAEDETRVQCKGGKTACNKNGGPDGDS